MVKKILILLAFLLVFTGVNALTLNENSAETCATDTSIFIFSVQNTENFENSYTISLSDSAGRWTIAAPEGFNLKPTQSQQVYVYVTPGITALPGTYPLKITVSSMAKTDTATATITVKDCHSATLTAAAAETNVCSATEAKYQLTLKNTGKYTENFALAISGVPAKWSTLSDELVKLTAGQTKDITVYSTPPADQTGNFALTVKAASQNSAALASADLKLISKPCYDYSASIDTNYVSFCENSEAKIPLAVENKGSVDNSYAIDVQGPVWSTVENKNIDLRAGEGKFTNVILFPGFGVAGDFNIKITINPKTGDSQEQIIQANVRNCHSTSLKLSSVEDTICPMTSKVYAVSLVNTGEFAEKYSIIATGATFASLDKNFIELEPGNSTEFNLLVEPKDIPSGTNTIVVRAEAQDPSHAASTAELKLDVAPMSSCFGVQATAAITKVSVSAGEPAVVPIIIENKGLENSTYNLDVSGTGAQFVQLNPASLNINGMSAKTVYAYVAVPEQTAEDTYKVTVSARLADGTVSSTTTFNINLGNATEEQPTKTETTAATPRERLIAIKDRIVAFFKSIKTPVLNMPNITLPELKLPSFGKGNETEEANQTEEITPVENQTEELPSNVSQYLSPELAEKLNATNEINKTEEQNKTTISAGLAAIREKFGSLNMPKLKMPSLPAISLPALSLPSLSFVKDFLMQSTYYIPNWLFIILVIVIVAGLSYLTRKKGLVKKFNDFLEEDTNEPKAEEKKEDSKPAAQDILDEVSKKENKKPRGRPKKK